MKFVATNNKYDMVKTLKEYGVKDRHITCNKNWWTPTWLIIEKLKEAKIRIGNLDVIYYTSEVVDGLVLALDGEGVVAYGDIDKEDLEEQVEDKYEELNGKESGGRWDPSYLKRVINTKFLDFPIEMTISDRDEDKRGGKKGKRSAPAEEDFQVGDLLTFYPSTYNWLQERLGVVVRRTPAMIEVEQIMLTPEGLEKFSDTFGEYSVPYYGNEEYFVKTRIRSKHRLSSNDGFKNVSSKRGDKDLKVTYSLYWD